jgi:hypothetical protein
MIPELVLMANKLINRAKPAAKFLIAGVIVVSTYGIWAINAYRGNSVNPLLVGLGIVITLAAARVVFGAGSMSKALGLAGDVIAMSKGEDPDAEESSDGDEQDSGPPE